MELSRPTLTLPQIKPTDLCTPAVIKHYVRGVLFLVSEAPSEDVPGSEGSGGVAPPGDIVPVAEKNGNNNVGNFLYNEQVRVVQAIASTQQATLNST